MPHLKSDVKSNKVAVIGEFFIDEVFSEFNAFPKLGEECFARRFQREVGGGAAITACGLARLGTDVGVFGLVGRADGKWVIDRLKSFDIDCSGLEFHPSEPTGITVSASTREDRAFFTYYGANLPLEEMIRRPATAAALSRYSYVHFACAPEWGDRWQALSLTQPESPSLDRRAIAHELAYASGQPEYPASLRDVFSE